MKRHIENWHRVNEPIGKELGYPDCCIKEFCDQPPELMKISKPTQIDIDRYNAGCLNGQFTGFIPCGAHAKLILSGKITLSSLVQNRDPELPEFSMA